MFHIPFSLVHVFSMAFARILLHLFEIIVLNFDVSGKLDSNCHKRIEVEHWKMLYRNFYTLCSDQHV